MNLAPGHHFFLFKLFECLLTAGHRDPVRGPDEGHGRRDPSRTTFSAHISMPDVFSRCLIRPRAAKFNQEISKCLCGCTHFLIIDADNADVPAEINTPNRQQNKVVHIQVFCV